MKELTAKYQVQLSAYILLILVMASFFFGIRAGVSISTVLCFACTVFIPGPLYLWRSYNRHTIWFIVAVLVFILLQFIAMFYTADTDEGWKNIYMKSGLLICSVGFFGSLSAIRYDRNKFIFSYLLILSGGLLFCFLINLLHYYNTGDISVFFYYKLLLPARQHAIYYSLFVFAGLIMVTETINKRSFIVKEWIYYFFGCLFLIFLFLLSSRLIIGIACVYILFLFLQKTIRQTRGFLILGLPMAVALLALVSFTNNPVSQRFSELLNGQMELVTSETNTPADYFNGWQFRLLQWKLVPQILDENQAWRGGVSPGDAQHFLDKKYRQRHMYTGDPSRHEDGLLGYYTHNSYLEAALQLGIPGLISIIFLMFTMLMITWKVRKTGYAWIGLALLAVSFTESLFESQYGIIAFSFLSVLMAVIAVNRFKTV